MQGLSVEDNAAYGRDKQLRITQIYGIVRMVKDNTYQGRIVKNRTAHTAETTS